MELSFPVILTAVIFVGAYRDPDFPAFYSEDDFNYTRNEFMNKEWTIVANSMCEEKRSAKKEAANKNVSNENVLSSKIEMFFCTRFQIEFLSKEKAMSCSYAGNSDWFGYAANLVGLSGPISGVIVLPHTILTGWSPDGFKSSIEGGKNCYREGTRGDQNYTTRTYVTRIDNSTALLCLEIRDKDKKHFLLVTSKKLSSLDLNRNIEKVLMLFPAMGHLCTTYCSSNDFNVHGKYNIADNILYSGDRMESKILRDYGAKQSAKPGAKPGAKHGVTHDAKHGAKHGAKQGAKHGVKKGAKHP